jgi:hypothetical protein
MAVFVVGGMGLSFIFVIIFLGITGLLPRFGIFGTKGSSTNRKSKIELCIHGSKDKIIALEIAGFVFRGLQQTLNHDPEKATRFARHIHEGKPLGDSDCEIVAQKVGYVLAQYALHAKKVYFIAEGHFLSKANGPASKARRVAARRVR